MALGLSGLSDENKFVQALLADVLEQLSPRELTSELLKQCKTWESENAVSTKLIMVYYVIACSSFRSLNLAAVVQ